MIFMLELAAPLRVFAAADCSLVFTNVEIGDQVEIYRIASYAEGKFEWESEVTNWIASSEEGKAYTGLGTQQLLQMTADRVQEFCESFLISCKDDAKGIAKLEGYSFTVTEEKEEYTAANMTPGYYIILPKGKNRIYQIKWAVLNPAETVRITYDEAAGDYQLPTIETSVVNKTVSDREFVWQDDEMEVNATVKAPAYPNMYATGKRILNATIIIPKGLSYVTDSLKAQADGEDRHRINIKKNFI